MFVYKKNKLDFLAKYLELMKQLELKDHLDLLKMFWILKKQKKDLI